MALNNVATKISHSGHLLYGKIDITMSVARVLNFNTNRARVHILFAAPTAAACMPSAYSFIHHLRDGAAFIHQIVARNLALMRSEPLKRFSCRFHAGIMPQQNGNWLARITFIYIG